LILDDSYVQKIDLNGALVSGEDFEIGTAPMAMAKVELIEDEGSEINYDFEGKEGDIELGIKTIVAGTATHGNLSNYTHQELSERTHGDMNAREMQFISIGKFTVEKAVKKNNVITLDCVDRMYKSEKEYVSD